MCAYVGNTLRHELLEVNRQSTWAGKVPAEVSQPGIWKLNLQGQGCFLRWRGWAGPSIERKLSKWAQRWEDIGPVGRHRRCLGGLEGSRCPQSLEMNPQGLPDQVREQMGVAQLNSAFKTIEWELGQEPVLPVTLTTGSAPTPMHTHAYTLHPHSTYNVPTHHTHISHKYTPQHPQLPPPLNTHTHTHIVPHWSCASRKCRQATDL